MRVQYCSCNQENFYRLANVRFIVKNDRLDAKGKPNGKLGPMNPTNPTLYEFLRHLFAEIVQVFPDQYVHLGGDEVPFDCWKSNPEINSYMKSRNISSYNLLESEYIGRLLRITDSLEANTIVWQEVNVCPFFFYLSYKTSLAIKRNNESLFRQ